MRVASRVAAALALAVAAGQGGAARAACGGSLDAAGGPLPAGIEPADYGAIPEACGGTDATLRLRGTALVASEMPDYYGSIVAASTLRLRLRVGRTGRTWLSFAADVVTFRYVVNAVLASEGFSIGPPTLGVHRALADGDRFAATIYARALLPLDSARANGVRMGLELGTALRRALGTRGRWGIEGGAALVSPLDVVGGQSHGSLESVALGQGWYAGSSVAAFFAGAAARVAFAPDASFISLAPRAGVRIASSRGPSFSFLAEVPVAGADRTSAILAIFLGWTPPPPPRGTHGG